MVTGTICFDMDGTIADLYGVENWLSLLRAEDPSPYRKAAPMWDMAELNEVLMLLEKEGWGVRIISWLSKDSTPEYDKAVRKAKAEWLRKWQFPYQKCHFVKYGTTKANCVRKACGNAPCILIDDNDKVRKGWHLGETIDPIEIDLPAVLKQYLSKGD